MEIVAIFVCLSVVFAVLAVRWLVLRDRLLGIESRIAELAARIDAQSQLVAEISRKSQADVCPTPAAPAPVPLEPPRVMPVVEPPRVEKQRPEPRAIESPTVEPAAAPREWETMLGGNWLNKLGVFVLVVGLALLLRYSFTRFGPLGRVSISLAVSLAMLAAGAILESKERYRIFARGLLGGGWAGLYVTVFAMHAMQAARVIESPVMGAVLLMAVAAGMILQSLRYRSQTVTGLAYFVAFGTLAITDTTALAFVALVPLAASLLYVAHRFAWTRMALLGLVATYAVIILRGDTGAPLWQTQTVFAIYWLLFEAFDVLHPEAWLLPLNAAGFLGLSVMKWQAAAPDRLWVFLAASAGAYLVSGAARIRSGKWQGAATLTGALAAGTIFQKLNHQWVASALVVEAELFYLAGIRLRAPYLRWLGTSLFGLETLRLLAIDLRMLPAGQWVPVASLDAVVFYVNRALYATDYFYGYAAAGMLALVIGKKTHEPYRSVAWKAAAAGAFALGWWRRLFDFRVQGYLLLALGLTGAAVQTRALPFAFAAGLCYAAVLCALWSGEDRFGEDERFLIRWGGVGAAVGTLMALVWRLVPGEYLGIGWMALAVLVLELGLRRLPDEFRRVAYAVAAAGACRVWLFNSWNRPLLPAGAALLAYAIGIRARHEEGGRVLTAASSVGLVFVVLALWASLPAEMVPAAWAAVALALLLAERQWKRGVFGWQSCDVAALAYFFSMAHLPDTSEAIWRICAVIACFYAAQLVSKPPSRRRLYFSLLATTLMTLLLYFRISGSLLTVAWGIEGAILLAAGFPLRDRVLRISGLTLLLACILKLFVWDLRHLETLPRIFSFIALGLILMGVSWIYARFREGLSKIL